MKKLHLSKTIFIFEPKYKPKKKLLLIIIVILFKKKYHDLKTVICSKSITAF